MADVQDVLDTLAAQIAGFVYPNGTGEASVTGKAINAFPGWPMPNQIDNDMPQGIVDVSVFPLPNERNTTRYTTKAHVMSVVVASLTLSVSGSTVTVGGEMPSPFTPHNMAVLIGHKAYLYAVQSGDTLTSIATALATLIAADHAGTSNSGPVITLGAGAVPATARVGTTGTTAVEWERQAQTFQITVWAPDPATRKTVGSAIKTALAQVAFITMPDGFGARIRYLRNTLSDETQKVRVYRRDLFYDIEYATTVEQQTATVVTVKTTYQTTSGAPIVEIDS
ncbi:hypothetical protein [Paraburkholderia tropica]|uniref:hypothetical protein n=1 Tax=Paraburkholderia tropica TaxID=92647 RepID=UPI001F3EB9C5|nr:hypothetical protein [Paraburkholderia tropica]